MCGQYITAVGPVDQLALSPCPWTDDSFFLRGEGEQRLDSLQQSCPVFSLSLDFLVIITLRFSSGILM